MNHLLPSFNAGELSPRLTSRPDLDKYGSGCRLLQNFLIMPYGGVNRRPGTEWMGVTKYADRKARLIGFNFSVSTNYVLEFGHHYIRFWRPTGLVRVPDPEWTPPEPEEPEDPEEPEEPEDPEEEDPGEGEEGEEGEGEGEGGEGEGEDDPEEPEGPEPEEPEEPEEPQPPLIPLEIETPYTEAQLFELQFTQVNDVLFLVHPEHPVMTLSRYAEDDWRLEEARWDYPPFLDPNTTDVTLTASATTGDLVTLTASEALFQPEHVGAYFELTHTREASSVELALTSSGESAAIRVVGRWDFTTSGTWGGTIEIQRSTDEGDTWQTIRSYTGAKNRNISTNGTEEEEALMRLKFTYTDHTGDPAPKAHLEAYDALHSGVVRVVSVEDETTATVEVIKPLESTEPTKNWAEGAWSRVRGYPRTVCMHEQRMVYGGTRHKPQTLWASAIGDFYNFKLGSKDDDAFAFTLASVETNAICWLVSQQALCIGTAGDEYILRSSSDGAITPTNFQVMRQSHFGSKYAPALLANDAALFIQRQGRKIREFVYEFSKDGYVAADLTLLADHITEGGVVQTAFQQQPDAILWCVTGKGILAGMTYERAQNVVGWHRHTTDGQFESVASIYSADGADEVWVIVKRGNARFVERFDPHFREALEDEDKGAWFYLDCATRFVSETPMTEITGLERFEGRTVEVYADGAVEDPVTVTNGKVALPRPCTNVLIGLPYTSQLTPMPLDPGPMGDGTAQSRKFRVNRLVLRVYKSLGGEVQVSRDLWDPVVSRDMADRMDESPQPFTGDREIYIAKGFEGLGNVSVRQTQPLPLTLLALIPKYEVSGT